MDKFDVEEAIAACEEHCELLTDWECGFIDSVARDTDRGFELKPNTQEKLWEIYQKVPK